MTESDIKDILSSMGKNDCQIIVSIIMDDYSMAFSQAEPILAIDLMDDVARRMSVLPPSCSSMVEGTHLAVTGGKEDDLSSAVFRKLPEQAESIVVVMGDNGDSVFCIGKPSILTYLAIRTKTLIEGEIARD